MAHDSAKLQKITYFHNQKQVILRARKLYKRTTEFIQRKQVAKRYKNCTVSLHLARP